MILDFNKIKETIKAGTPDWVSIARKYSKKLEVHINGIGTAEYLSQVTGYENDRQYRLREKYATSNKFVFENLLRPVDKVFSANGGSKLLNTKTEQSNKILSEKLSNLVEGYPVRKWIEQVQSNKYYTDPSGVCFFEWEGVETYPTFKNINSIRNYESDGRQIEWILFEPEKRIDAKGVELPGDFYRFVDDEKDYLIYVVDEHFTIIEDETFDNPWGYVPAFTNSNISDSTLSYHISPIDSVIELADHYLRTNSVKNIYEFLHGYPIFWAYVEPCRTCDGTGLYDGKTCHTCNGDGHTFTKDVSDIIKLKPPRTTDEPQLAPDVAGYVQPDLDVWREQREELDWLWGLMHFSMWGTAQQDQAENETATAAFIDVQPVNDRLNKFADAFEQTEKLVTDILGDFYLLENYNGASINYGRRFLVEPPDIIWKKYITAKKDGAPKVSLDYLLTQYYQSEFKDDVEGLITAQKGIKIEPFIHSTSAEINLLPVMNEDKLAKFYFNEFWRSLKQQDIILKDVEVLKAEFETYLMTKKVETKEEDERNIV
jgi:hypothetical protein